MTVQPLISFKAGRCKGPDFDNSTGVKCLPTPGYVYLHISPEDDLMHFCWTSRANETETPELDLIMFPGDGRFIPYSDRKDTSRDVVSPTNGRIFVLKFSSSPIRHFFWLQSKPASGRPNVFSERELKIGEIVSELLSGEEVDVQGLLGNGTSGPDQPDDEDEDMGDAPPDHDLRRTNTGGAGADATGGDVREEGAEAREGGADGGRAVAGGAQLDANAAVQNFLRSLQGGGGAASQQQQSRQDGIFTTLSDLLSPEECINTLEGATPAYLNTLLSNLPPQLISICVPSDKTSPPEASDNPAAAEAAVAALSPEQKKNILRRVFRSPQFFQSAGSLTVALRDGGLPMVSEALRIKVENGGMIRGGHMPLGEGQAVQAFLEGVKKTVKEEEDEKKEGGGSMDTS